MLSGDITIARTLPCVDEREQLGEGEVSRRVAAAAHAEEDEQRDGDAPGCDDESFTRRRAAWKHPGLPGSSRTWPQAVPAVSRAHPATRVLKRRAGDSVLMLGCCGALQPASSVAGASDACKPLPYWRFAQQRARGPGRNSPCMKRIGGSCTRLHVGDAPARVPVRPGGQPVRACDRFSERDHDPNRLLRLAIQALERGPLPCRAADRRVVRSLRANVRHGRDQQQLLPPAGARTPSVAGASARLPGFSTRSRRAAI